MTDSARPADPTTLAHLTWRRDTQGLHADSPSEDLRYYVRRDGRAWRTAFCVTTVVAGLRVPESLTTPMRTVDRSDTQAMAKKVAEAFEVEPWSDGGAMRRETRAINRAYAADRAGSTDA